LSAIDPRLAVVVPTRNRPGEVAILLASLREQTRQPNVVVVVDSSDADLQPAVVRAVAEGWLAAHYIEHSPPSAAAQRNHGLDIVGKDCDLVALLDDDVTLSPDTLANALAEIAAAPDTVIGFGLNPLEEEARIGYGAWKRSAFARALGLYSPRVGAITRSGWHTRLLRVDHTQEVEWLTSCAVMWRISALDGLRFDEFFVQYSYLEDLEFSLQARPRGHFWVLASANYLHSPSPAGRKSQFWFGRTEIRNRRYIVGKHGLSVPRFWLGAMLRGAMTFGEGLTGRRAAWERLAGNLAELGQNGFGDRRGRS
jgi:GT2 family glycosyltransferase